MMMIPTTLNNYNAVIVSIKDTDVLCGSKNTLLGKHHGNVLLRKQFHQHLSNYEQSSTKRQRVAINRTILNCMRRKYGSRFLRQKENGDWVEMDEQGVRDKISHGLRFASIQRKREEEYQKHYVPAVQVRTLMMEAVDDAEDDDEMFTQMLETVFSRQQEILENMMEDEKCGGHCV